VIETDDFRIPQLNLARGVVYSCSDRNLSSRRFRRFIFDSRCNREKYRTRINSFTPKNMGGRDRQASRKGERARRSEGLL